MAVTLRSVTDFSGTPVYKSQSALMAVTLRSLSLGLLAVRRSSQSALMAVTLRSAINVAENVTNVVSQSALMAVTLRSFLLTVVLWVIRLNPRSWR